MKVVAVIIAAEHQIINLTFSLVLSLFQSLKCADTNDALKAKYNIIATTEIHVPTTVVCEIGAAMIMAIIVIKITELR